MKMGREVRKVPGDWQHPKDEKGHYIPLFDEYKKTLPMGRLGEPEEIGNFVKSIIENNIKYLSGVVINFDGANSNYIF